MPYRRKQVGAGANVNPNIGAVTPSTLPMSYTNTNKLAPILASYGPQELAAFTFGMQFLAKSIGSSVGIGPAQKRTWTRRNLGATQAGGKVIQASATRRRGVQAQAEAH